MSINVINPSTEDIVASYEEMPIEQVYDILIKMDQAQKIWQLESYDLKKELMIALGQELDRNQKEYANIITEEMGKPITQAIQEIKKCVDLCYYYAEHAQEMLAPKEIQTEHRKSYVSYKPLGIIYAIMPWNFPFWQVLRVMIPNIMAGNAFVLKHAENSIGAANAIEKALVKVGFPENLMRSIVIDISLSNCVINHSLVKGVTLTGSERAGIAVGEQSGRALKKVVLELGGSDPYVILEDADLDKAAKEIVSARLSNAGQICISPKRIIVVNSIYDAFISKVKDEIENNFVCMDPKDINSKMGPMARKDLMLQLAEQVKKTVVLGAKLELGGNVLDRVGFYYEPTLLTGVTKGMPAYDEELFGPVVSILPARDEVDAIEIANDSSFGLGAAIYTKDIRKGELIARDFLEAGTCCVNKTVASDQRLPFGGINASGFGRELSVEGLREFVNIKTIVVNE